MQGPLHRTGAVGRRQAVQHVGAQSWFTACERTLPPPPNLQVDLEPDAQTIYGPDP